MTLSFRAQVIVWRGPAPFLFIPLPPEASTLLASTPSLSYGWGCIPATAHIGETSWKTSLMPRQGTYLVPVKMVVQRAEGVIAGIEVDISVEVG